MPIKRIKNGRLTLRPAQIIILGFCVTILLAAFVFCLPIAHKDRQWFPFTDAFFAAASAVCVNGLLTVEITQSFSLFGQIALLIFLQIGGLGFMTLTTLMFLVLKKRITLRERLVMQESVNSDSHGSVHKLIGKICLLTLVTEFLGFLILLVPMLQLFGGKGAFFALFSSVSAFCNAGFSIIPEPSFFIEHTLMGIALLPLILLGGIGFSVILDICRAKNFLRLQLHSKIVLTTTVGLLALSIIFVFVAEILYGKNAGTALYEAVFLAFNSRSSGFAMDLNSMSPAARLFVLFLSFVGASPGSCAGGIKTTTFMLIILSAISGIKSSEEVRIFGNSVSKKTVFRAFSVFVSYILLILLVCAVLSISENDRSFSLEQIIFEAFAAVTTSGLSLGITPYVSAFGKFVLIFAMLLGRVGPVTASLTLLKDKEDIIVKYPEGQIMVG